MAPRILTKSQIDEIAAPQAPPDRRRLWGEVAAVMQPLRLATKCSALRNAPRGNGRTAMLLPGWRAPEESTLPIGGFLRNRGHDARGWGLGINYGDVEQTRDQLLPKVEQWAADTGRPINLVGWSLGGVIAREVARMIPESVNHVVTYGSPILGGPTYTVGASTYGAEECERILNLQQELDKSDPIVTPITAIFTRIDNAVDWRACVDRTSPNVTMIEVQSTHVGLGIDPDVWLAAAQAMAAERDDA